MILYTTKIMIERKIMYMKIINKGERKMETNEKYVVAYGDTFNELNKVDVGNHIETKGNQGLKYLSWAWAWAEVKKRYSNANYTIYETQNPQGYICNYFTDGKTCWVKTGVEINGVEHIEELPVMDYNNHSILLSNVTSFDVNKAIQRSLTKAVARHGLGLYIYAGEDLPDEADLQGTAQVEPKQPKREPIKVETPSDDSEKKVRACNDPKYTGLKENAGSISDMQILRMRELNINLENACEYLNVPSIDLMSVEQADYIIKSKEAKANK